MEAMNIPYFDLQEGIIEGFNRKQGDVRSQVEALALVDFKSKPRSRNVSKKSTNDSFEEEYGETFSNDPEARRQRYEQYEREQQEKGKQQAQQMPPRRSGQRSGNYDDYDYEHEHDNGRADELPRRSGSGRRSGNYDYEEEPPVPRRSGQPSGQPSGHYDREPEPPAPRRSGQL
ncbi:hypothetical protein FF38_10473, partial [Lucilia cuprina]